MTRAFFAGPVSNLKALLQPIVLFLKCNESVFFMVKPSLAYVSLKGVFWESKKQLQLFSIIEELETCKLLFSEHHKCQINKIIEDTKIGRKL